MIPKIEEVLKEKGVEPNPFWDDDLISISVYSAIVESYKEYGRRLLDHVAEEALNDGLTREEILKIKDEL